MSPYRPKKRLGQNFLTDEQVAFDIVKAIDPHPGDHAVEIGPGTGALTEHLLREGCFVTAIEFDRDLIPILKARFGKHSNLLLMAKDILRVNIQDLPEYAKIIGNLPYNISTVIIEKLFDFKTAVEMAVFTVQAEVAQRITAVPGGRDYGSFTVIMAAGFKAEKLFEIPPKAFSPAPLVDSTVIRLVPVDKEPADFENFKVFIRGCFKQKRKTLVNSMQLGLNVPKINCEGLIEEAGLKQDIRPEQLSFEDYIKLYKSWCVT